SPAGSFRRGFSFASVPCASSSKPQESLSDSSMRKVAIIGASGYSGEELVRLLLNHPQADLVAVTSRQSAGQTVAQVFPKFASHPKSRALRFSDPNAEVLGKQ